MGGGLGRVTHHPDYYLEDGSVSFLSDGILFRVHKTFLSRESTVFRDLFENSANDDPPPGTDACPFRLEDVTPDDFAQLLWVWYDREYGYRQQTKANWLTILRLANRWHFLKIKELALREIEFLELPPAERISIYDDYGIDGERFVSSCVELCKSPMVPTRDEVRGLKMDTLIKILQAREDAQSKAVSMGYKTPTSACLEDEVLREIVSKLFDKGLNPQSSGTSTGSGDQAPDSSTTHGTQDAISTIIVGEPQVPGRKTQSHLYNVPQINGDGTESREKSKNKRKEGNQLAEGEGEKKPGEDQEKFKKEKAEKAKQVHEKENANQVKEREKAKRAEEREQTKQTKERGKTEKD